MPTTQTIHETLLNTLFNEIWNQKKLDKIQDVFTSDVILHVPKQTIRGQNAIKEVLAHWQSAFPDLHHQIDQIIYSEDFVTARWRGAGTHLGIFLGMFPTKKKIEYSGITIFKVENGKFSEIWVNGDMQSIFSTLKTFSDKTYTEIDFCEDFKGPAAKIYEWVMKARSVQSCKQITANALREIYSTCPLDGLPALDFPKELMDTITVQEHFIPTKEGKIRSLVYLPKGYQNKNYPMLLYFHGGGWTVGSPESVDLISRKFAYTANIIVITPDYRLAPEFPYPNGLNDCVGSYLWARKKGKQLFNANQNKIAVAGDSAGGNLAPSVVIRMRNEKIQIPDACLMLCPLTDFAFEQYPSTHQYGYKGLVYDYSMISFVRSVYLKYDQWKLPEVSPMYDHLQGFCPSFVLTAGQDLLHDENLIFVNKLKKAGAHVEHLIHQDMPHGYYYFLGFTKEEDEAYTAMSRFLNKVLD